MYTIYAYRSGDHEAEYTAEYKMQSSSASALPITTLNGDEDGWNKQTVERSMTPPTVTIENLEPGATYEVGTIAWSNV